MADAEDLVALILSALGASSESELCMLSELLASESSLQLQRLWLLVGSPSRCLSIIAFLDSLSHDHRRLLVARVTLRLVCRITDFLEDASVASTSSQQSIDSSVGNLVHRDRAHLKACSSVSALCSSVWIKEDVPASVEGTTIVVPFDADIISQQALDTSIVNLVHTDRAHQSSQASCSSFLGHLNPDLSKEDMTASVEGTTMVVPTYANNDLQQKEKESKPSPNVHSKHANMPRQQLSSTPLSSSQNIDVRNQMPYSACVAELMQFSDNLQNSDKFNNSGLTKPNISVSLAKPGAEYTNDSVAHVDVKGPFHAHSDPVNINLAFANVEYLDFRNSPRKPFKERLENADSASPVLASMCSRAGSSNSPHASMDLCMDMASTSCEDEPDNVSLPWGETDAAFVFLFLWETQERECQEAMQRWCVDPFVYHLLIVQDMSVLVDEKKTRRIRAPRWRERLKQYLLQNVLQVGYGFPGIIASENLPASLSSYIETIGRFQRVLNSMNIEESSEPKLPAASEATLHSLPTSVIGLSSEDKGKVCIICKEDLEPSSVASQLPCMHVYHWDCILSWLKQRNNCPVCRHEFPTDDYDHELQRKIQILRERIALNT